MQTRPIVKVTANDAGCWVDGVRGWHAVPYMVDVAERHGYPLSDEDRETVEKYDAGDEVTTLEEIHEIASEAESWMNENVAPDGYSFGWYEGNFMLWSESDWSDVLDA